MSVYVERKKTKKNVAQAQCPPKDYSSHEWSNRWRDRSSKSSEIFLKCVCVYVCLCVHIRLYKHIHIYIYLEISNN